MESYEATSIDSLIVCSVVENRAREVSIVRMDSSHRSVIELFLVNDSHSYSETIMTLVSIQPHEILLQDGTQNKTLPEKIIKQFAVMGAHTRVVFISRQYFDQDRGADMLKKVAASEVDADLIAKYIVLAGCYCLLRYMENCSGTIFQANSLRVQYSSRSTQRLHIDRHTACNLEIISDLRTGNQRDSLYGSIKMTKTVVGARLLKSNLLRPLTDCASIIARLDTVETFLHSPHAFARLSALLPQFPDLDRCLSGLTTVPKTVSIKTAGTSIETLIMLKSSIKLSLQIGGILREVCTTSHSRHNIEPLLLRGISNKLLDDELVVILGLIDHSLNDGISFSKNIHEMKQNECFALKSEVDAKLDVSRVAFLESVEQIYALSNQYSEDLNCSIKVVFNTTRGYYLQVPSTVTFLPDSFIQAVQQRKTISCTTREVLSLSDRANESLGDCLLITNDLLQILLTDIRLKINSVFTLVDSIALLDLILSFADLVALSPMPYTRPQIKTSGPIVIKKGRHPIVEKVQKQLFVENDTFLSSLGNFIIVTGYNGAGKTVYLKQVALIVILAQIGCFVPATFACVVPRDRILSRIGTADDLENNMSTFLVEMKDSSYILENLTDRSLVIIDELGRGTSNVDGISLAFAIAESLAQSKAFTLFVTHFAQLTSLSSIYSNVKNIHLRTQLDMGIVGAGSVKYLHEVSEGACELKSGYGIMIAELCRFPPEMIKETKRVQQIVKEKYQNLIIFPVNQVDRTLDTMNSLLEKLSLLNDSTLDDVGLRVYLKSLASSVSPEIKAEILSLLQSKNATANAIFESINVEEEKKSGLDSFPDVLDLFPRSTAENSADAEEEYLGFDESEATIEAKKRKISVDGLSVFTAAGQSRSID